MAYNFTTIEKKWQQYWLTNKSFAALDTAVAAAMPKMYILDMFPYPSGAGLHVGHPEGYTATDIYSRYLRMKGYNVLHPMGWDAFGLPAEQYAIKTNTHARDTTQRNIDNFRRQIQMLGLSYDWDREIDTTDPSYYKWTQWIFLQIFNSYFDPVEKKAKPIAHLMQELANEHYVVAPDGSIHLNPTHEGMEQLSGQVQIERAWIDFSEEEQQDIIDNQRLAYMAEIPVNWCPVLGTVLANEEVIDGKSEVGGFPVEKRPMRQWMMRITAYADRLIEDLDLLQWPESLKEMQRNWIGKSVGAEVDFLVDLTTIPAGPIRHEGEQFTSDEPAEEDKDKELEITVFTTRPDTLYGATYMVLAPEHPLVERITSAAQRPAVEAYKAAVATKSERDRMAEVKEKTGVFTGAYAINPVNEAKIPVWIADYVLMGYGTGAIMAVPAHDERDFAFAQKFNLPITAVVMPDEEWLRDHATAALRKRAQSDAKIDTLATEQGDPALAKSIRESLIAKTTTAIKSAPIDKLRQEYADRPETFGEAFSGDGLSINSLVINDLPTPKAKAHIIALLDREGAGKESIKFKLRDWLFSRQRYWGEPFPVVLDENGRAYALPEDQLPVMLPEMQDFKPTGTGEPPLAKATDWLRVEMNGRVFQRETNTMPQWAGSCWYYLRYIDPKNDQRFLSTDKEKYWMPVDLYVGGTEHAVLHLLYARFWHKVLFDLSHVSTPEPFQRLVNQGMILGEAEYSLFHTPGGDPVSAADLRDINEQVIDGQPRLVGLHKQTDQLCIAKRITEEQAERSGDGFALKGNPAIRLDVRSFKMSKARGNVVNPDDIVKDYGADCFRLYEMYMGPLEAQKPWNTRDIVGMARFLNSIWRNLIGDEEKPDAAPRIADVPIPDALDRMLHRTIKKVAEDIEALRFNTGIAELIKLNNELTGLAAVPESLAESFTLMLAPFAPHLAEELWQRLGNASSLARHPWPAYDPAKLVESTLELPVQVNGKLRDKITVPADATEDQILQTAATSEKTQPWLANKTILKRLYVPKKLVNFVVR